MQMRTSDARGEGANDVDLVEAGYFVPGFLKRIIEIRCQRWAQLEIDRINLADEVVQ